MLNLLRNRTATAKIPAGLLALLMWLGMVTATFAQTDCRGGCCIGDVARSRPAATGHRIADVADCCCARSAVDDCRRADILTTGTGEVVLRHLQDNRPAVPPVADIRSVSSHTAGLKSTVRSSPFLLHPSTPLYIRIARLLC